MSMVDPKALTAALNAAGIDPVQFHKDLEESGDAFANQFDRSNPDFDKNWNMKPVPTGGSRVPESMGGDAASNWRDLPENQMAIEPEYPPEYHTAMAEYELFNKVKKTISILNKPVENAFKVRFQYKGAEGDDKIALESRLKGEENQRDGALNAAQALFDKIDPACLSDRSKNTMKELFERGRYPFEDRNTMGDYMLVLQRGNQALFADQKKLLEKIKKIKKEASKPTASPVAPPLGNGGYGGEQAQATPKVDVDKEAPVPAATAGA
eukprot:gnl/MRDRNA2_/MRDRNA2_78090_c0_seq1.p1 gnl/MRDRNA2_/MRDRNA2_78090_c0~~gnl/MRDRNA2_/MRDRNA2_78090_c0_seq1.p1  ORF type:complete len:267 (+),score=79.32 gnl/MRDRNA2_/MRDRNA2_78090_c0_seq1:98-898(+)